MLAPGVGVGKVAPDPRLEGGPTGWTHPRGAGYFLRRIHRHLFMTDVTQPLAAALSDRYRIDRELGRGGMATVYLADDLKHARQVAGQSAAPTPAIASFGPRGKFSRRSTSQAGTFMKLPTARS